MKEKIIRLNLKLYHVLLFALCLSMIFAGATAAPASDAAPSGGEIYDLRLKGEYDPAHIAPVWIRPSPMNEATVQVFDDGTIKIYYAPGRHDTRVLSVESRDGGLTWTNPTMEFRADGVDQYPRRTLIDKDGDVHLLAFRSANNDVWHTKTTNGKWGPLTKVTDGRIGAIRAFIQTRSGRLVYAYHRRLRDRKPPIGSSSTTAVFSDDNGRTWTESGDWITAPCRADFNGNNYGAVEPTIVQLNDGRLWVLCRTQTGWQYQAFSDDEGRVWTEGRPSMFHSSNSPANLLRLPDGRLVLTWCNTAETDLRTFGRIYTHRDVLHMAVSDDDGETWRGFREVFRIPTRNDQNNLPRSDHGTSYPNTAFTKQGKIILVTGQGEHGGGRAVFLVDPKWLYQVEQEDDFSRGLEKWTCYTFTKLGSKPKRMLGPGLEDEPNSKGGKVLHIRKKYAQFPGDGAVWNFPMGRKGKIEMTLMVKEGSKGTAVSLTDHHRHPNDPDGEKTAMFTFRIGGTNGMNLQCNRWHRVILEWDLELNQCEVLVNGKTQKTLHVNTATATGISYIRFRNVAPKNNIDGAGMYLDDIKAAVSDCATRPSRGVLR